MRHATHSTHGNSSTVVVSCVSTVSTKAFKLSTSRQQTETRLFLLLSQILFRVTQKLRPPPPPPPLIDIEHLTKSTFDPAPAKTKPFLSPSSSTLYTQKQDKQLCHQDPKHNIKSSRPKAQDYLDSSSAPHPTRGNYHNNRHISRLLNYYRTALCFAVALRLLAFVRGGQIWGCGSRLGFPRWCVWRTPGTADAKTRRRIFLEKACAFII